MARATRVPLSFGRLFDQVGGPVFEPVSEWSAMKFGSMLASRSFVLGLAWVLLITGAGCTQKDNDAYSAQHVSVGGLGTTSNSGVSMTTGVYPPEKGTVTGGAPDADNPVGARVGECPDEQVISGIIEQHIGNAASENNEMVGQPSTSDLYRMVRELFIVAAPYVPASYAGDWSTTVRAIDEAIVIVEPYRDARGDQLPEAVLDVIDDLNEMFVSGPANRVEEALNAQCPDVELMPFE